MLSVCVETCSVWTGWRAEVKVGGSLKKDAVADGRTLGCDLMLEVEPLRKRQGPGIDHGFG